MEPTLVSTILGRRKRQDERESRNAKRIVDKLNEERRGGRSDLVVNVPEGGGFVTVHMHRILARELLSEQTCEKITQTGAREVTISDQFPAWAVSAIVDWVYTSALPVSLTCESAVCLLRAADFHNQPGLFEALCEWIDEHMRDVDAAAVFDTAGALCKLRQDECLKALSTRAMRVIGANVLSLLASGFLDDFPAIIQDLQFVPCEQVALIVAKHFAHKGNKEALFKVNYGVLPKTVLARAVADLTVAGLMTPELTAHVLRSSLKPSGMTQRKYSLNGAICCISLDGAAHAFVPGHGVFARPSIFPESETVSASTQLDSRLSAVIENGEIVVAMLHGDRRHVCSYDTQTALWWYKSRTDNGISDSAATVTSEGLALLGGAIVDVDGEHSSSVGWCEIRRQGAWSKLPSLPALLAGGCAVSTNDSVYFLGGHNGSGPSSSVFVHRFGNKGFVSIGSLEQPRWHFAAVIVGNEIFCFGGAGFDSRASCEVFDVVEKKARRISDAPIGNKPIHSAWRRDGRICVVAETMLLSYSHKFDAWEIVSNDLPSCAKALSFQ